MSRTVKSILARVIILPACQGTWDSLVTKWYSLPIWIHVWCTSLICGKEANFRKSLVLLSNCFLGLKGSRVLKKLHNTNFCAEFKGNLILHYFNSKIGLKSIGGYFLFKIAGSLNMKSVNTYLVSSVWGYLEVYQRKVQNLSCLQQLLGLQSGLEFARDDGWKCTGS